MTTARKRLPDRRMLETFAIAHGGQRYKIGLGRKFGSTEVAEVFVNAQQVNSALDVIVSDGAILMSLLLQYGHAPAEIAKSMKKNPDGSPSSPLGCAAALIDQATQPGE